MELGWVLPDWLDDLPSSFSDEHQAMRFTLGLAERNIHEQGGPFAALVLDEAGRPLAAGTNRVVSASCSVLHAEIVALMLAQQRLHSHRLTGATLFSTCAPCAMCLGALPWAGIACLYCAARSEDAERIGFDEGDKPLSWPLVLGLRGVAVHEDLLRDEAVRLFTLYQQLQCPLY